jgi:hypothetical protein
MALFLIFIALIIIFCYWPKANKEEIDFSKDSDYYLKKYPDLLKTPEKEKPNVTINITHNHLHITPEDLRNYTHSHRQQSKTQE